MFNRRRPTLSMSTNTNKILNIKVRIVLFLQGAGGAPDDFRASDECDVFHVYIYFSVVRLFFSAPSDFPFICGVGQRWDGQKNHKTVNATTKMCHPLKYNFYRLVKFSAAWHDAPNDPYCQQVSLNATHDKAILKYKQRSKQNYHEVWRRTELTDDHTFVVLMVFEILSHALSNEILLAMQYRDKRYEYA